MYKIYVNGTPVFLTNREGVAELGFSPTKYTDVSFYLGKKRQIKQFLDKLNKNADMKAIVLYAENVEGLWKDFQDCYKILEASGGYVLNEKGELLVFYRRNSWDMPKGKIDPGETPEIAAVREVQEETGLVNVDLGKFLCHTYHTYEHKGDKILKKTWWYAMNTTDNQVVPQTEEDIEEIKWVEPKAWLATKPEVYGSILDVIQEGMK